MDNDIFCSVVIPVHNEEKNIMELYARLTRVLFSLNKPYEIIYVNDGSIQILQLTFCIKLLGRISK